MGNPEASFTEVAPDVQKLQDLTVKPTCLGQVLRHALLRNLLESGKNMEKPFKQVMSKLGVDSEHSIFMPKLE